MSIRDYSKMKEKEEIEYIKKTIQNINKKLEVIIYELDDIIEEKNKEILHKM